MTEIYVMKVIYERNATDGIHPFTSQDALAEAVLEAWATGAVDVRVFRCVEVNFTAYWQRANIDIGKDKV